MKRDRERPELVAAVGLDLDRSLARARGGASAAPASPSRTRSSRAARDRGDVDGVVEVGVPDEHAATSPGRPQEALVQRRVRQRRRAPEHVAQRDAGQVGVDVERVALVA